MAPGDLLSPPRSTALEGRLFIGVLGLGGHVRPVRGALIVAELAAQVREVIVPVANAGEAALADVPTIGVRSLEEAVGHLCAGAPSAGDVDVDLRYAARFALVAAMAPCPCGYFGDLSHECHFHPTSPGRSSIATSGRVVSAGEMNRRRP